MSGELYSLDNCIPWRTVFSGGLYSLENCILWRTVLSGELYSLENCILWRTIFSGELYSPENCILWRTVFSGELYSLENYMLWRTVQHEMISYTMSLTYFFDDRTVSCSFLSNYRAAPQTLIPIIPYRHLPWPSRSPGETKLVYSPNYYIQCFQTQLCPERAANPHR